MAALADYGEELQTVSEQIVSAGQSFSGDTYLIMIWLMLPAKGQLISEWLFDVLNNLTQKFDKFLPKNLKSGQIIR